MIIRRKKLVQTEQEPKIEEQIVQTPKKEEPEVQPVEIFDVDNFDFLQRDERRRGDRRRGYRRIDDRNLVSRAQSEAVSLKEEAVKEGYNQGLEQAGVDIAELREELKEFYNYKNKVADTMSKDVLDIALDIARTIIKKEVEQDKDILLNIIADILKDSGKSEGRVTLKVAPEDVEFVKMSMPQILSMAQVEVKMSVTGDENIDNGSVIVETSNGVTDASFKTQLGVLREAFKGI